MTSGDRGPRVGRIVAILSGTAAVMLAMVPAAAAQDPAGLQRRCERMGLEIGVTGDNVKRYAAACIQNGGRPPDPRPFMPAKTTPAPDPAARARRCERAAAEMGLRGSPRAAYLARCERG